MKKIILFLSIPFMGIMFTSCKKIIKESIEQGSEIGVERGIKEIVSSDVVIKELYEQFHKDFADGIVVKSTKEGLEFVSKDFPTSVIRKNGNTIIGKAGSLIDNGPVNEFLNHLMPNSKYVVDDVFEYQTDKLGRVVSCSADRTKAFQNLGGRRNKQRNTDVQKMVVDKLDGRKGLDDGGHLFANTTGGPNELINQIPMNADLNRNGLWRKLEIVEEKALKQGKKVNSYRKLLYKGNSKRPYAIEFISEIDGVISRNIVENIY
jgi:hypothetical protein